MFLGLAPNWQLVLLSRFLVSFFVGGTISIVTLSMEHLLAEQRLPMRSLFNWGFGRLGRV
jgi:MFS family permease